MTSIASVAGKVVAGKAVAGRKANAVVRKKSRSKRNQSRYLIFFSFEELANTLRLNGVRRQDFNHYYNNALGRVCPGCNAHVNLADTDEYRGIARQNGTGSCAFVHEECIPKAEGLQYQVFTGAARLLTEIDGFLRRSDERRKAQATEFARRKNANRIPAQRP